VVNASDQYDTNQPGLLGENYRAAWRTKIEVPVFDIGTEKGGLKILKRGGGQQTRSLRLEAKDGKQYVLRSVEKYAEKAIPEALKRTGMMINGDGQALNKKEARCTGQFPGTGIRLFS